ncbi:MAG: hypothetical protein EBE86_021170 [Hormoscilla sp. GUM202]|nr:hypothetical protein [Hormoscilla sp. GUM202]
MRSPSRPVRGDRPPNGTQKPGFCNNFGIDTNIFSRNPVSQRPRDRPTEPIAHPLFFQPLLDNVILEKE